MSAILLCGCGSGDDDDSAQSNIPEGLIGLWGGSKTISRTGNERSLMVQLMRDLTYELSSYYRYTALNSTVNNFLLFGAAIVSLIESDLRLKDALGNIHRYTNN